LTRSVPLVAAVVALTIWAGARSRADSVPKNLSDKEFWAMELHLHHRAQALIT
jgi:hypothetical protein